MPESSCTSSPVTVTGPEGKAVEAVRYNFETDALEGTTVAGSVSLVHWKGGKYELPDFGSE